MASATISRTDPTTVTLRRGRTLRTIVTGAAAFDAAMGVFCLVAAGHVAGWLSIGTMPVRELGVVFLVAAAIGGETVLRPATSVRWIVGANLFFALWCLGVVALDGPNALGVVLFVGAALTSAGTALVEHRLAATA